MLLSILFVLSTVLVGCSKKDAETSANIDLVAKQKVIVVVTDKKTKAPVKEAKVYLIGDEKPYLTDEMGKTAEVFVDVNKDYFKNYIDEVASKVSCGFVNVVVDKEGYGKHFEVDYSIFPGDSPAMIKIELEKGKKPTTNFNAPDVNYVENLVRSYEKFEGEPMRSEDALKYKVTVVGEDKKPIEEAKIVVPEAKVAAVTDKKGACEVSIPFIESNNVNYPAKKEYGEITVLTYKSGYSSKALLKVHLSKDGKDNNITVQLSKSSKTKVEFEVVKPAAKWTENIMNSYK
jgi:hypothetical protein